MKKSEINAIIDSILAKGQGWKERRAKWDTIPYDVTIPCSLVLKAAECYALSRNPNDKGISGKTEEVLQRAKRCCETKHGMKRSDFHARAKEKADLIVNHISYEIKTGAGDWLNSSKSTLAEAIEEINAKGKHWRLIDIDAGVDITCSSLRVLCDLLGSYISPRGGKTGIEIWFKPPVKKEGKLVWQLQTYTSSQPKLEFLRSLNGIHE